LDGDAERPEPDGLLERDLDAREAGEAKDTGEARDEGDTGDIGDTGEAGDPGEPGSDPDGELARTGEADLDD